MIVKDGGSQGGKQNNVSAIVLNFFPCFIGDSIMSTSCMYLDVWRCTCIIQSSSPFLEMALSSSKTKLYTSSMCSKAGTTLNVHVHTLTLLFEASE